MMPQTLIIRMGSKQQKMAELRYQDGAVRLIYVDPAVRNNTQRWVRQGFTVCLGSFPHITEKEILPHSKDFLTYLKMHVESAFGANCTITGGAVLLGVCTDDVNDILTSSSTTVEQVSCKGSNKIDTSSSQWPHHTDMESIGGVAISRFGEAVSQKIATCSGYIR